MQLVQISGKPSSGKTTGARFLDPSKTYFIDADEKGLSWVGWKKTFNTAAKNYAAVSNPTQVYKLIKAIHDTRPEINCIVLDTINTIMTNEEMDIMKDKSRDAWADQCKVRIYLIAGSSLETFILQSKDEICLSLNV